MTTDKKDKDKLIDEIEAIIEKEINSNKIDFNFMHEGIRNRLFSFDEKENTLKYLKKDNTLIELLILKILPLVNNENKFRADSVFWETLELLASHGNYMSKCFFKKYINPFLKRCVLDKDSVNLTERELIINGLFSVKGKVIDEKDFTNFVLSTPSDVLGSYLLLTIKSNKELLSTKINFFDDKNRSFERLLNSQENINADSYSMKLQKAEIFLPEKINKNDMNNLMDFIYLDLNSFSLESLELIDYRKEIKLKHDLSDFFEFLVDLEENNKVPYFKLITGMENNGSIEAYDLCTENIFNVDNFMKKTPDFFSPFLTIWNKIKNQLEIELFNFRSSNEDEFNL